MLSSRQYNNNPTGEHNDSRKILSDQDRIFPHLGYDPLCRYPALPEAPVRREDPPQAAR